MNLIVEDGHHQLDFKLLKDLFIEYGSKYLIGKFEKYYGRVSEEDLSSSYFKYLQVRENQKELFKNNGTIGKSAKRHLNCPILSRSQFVVLEEYLFRKGIIAEKVFEDNSHNQS